MDISLLGRTLWRFKWITIGGFVAACVLAVFATARVSFAGGEPKLTYRTPVIYTTKTRILVTQSGFPWGRTILPSSTNSSGVSTTTYADPSRFVTLASVYAMLANGDQIQQKIVHPLKQEALTAQAEYDQQTQAPLPIIDIISLAPSPRRAVAIALEGASMLKHFVEAQQVEAEIPTDQRVLLQTLQQPYRVTVASGRKKTVPIVVFATVMLATIGLVLALENLRPRLRLGELGEFAAVRADEPVASSSRVAGGGG